MIFYRVSFTSPRHMLPLSITAYPTDQALLSIPHRTASANVPHRLSASSLPVGTTDSGPHAPKDCTDRSNPVCRPESARDCCRLWFSHRRYSSGLTADSWDTASQNILHTVSQVSLKSKRGGPQKHLHISFCQLENNTQRQINKRQKQIQQQHIVTPLFSICLVGMVVFYPTMCPFYRTPFLSARKKGASFDAPPTKNLWFFRGFRLLDTTVQMTLQRLA